MEVSIPLEFLASVLGTDHEQLATAFKDGETLRSPEEIQAAIDQAFKDKIYAERRSVKDDQYSRGRKEALTAKERELRKKYEDLEGSTIEEMIDAALSRSASSEVTPETVRQHAAYKADLANLKAQLEEALQERDGIIGEYKARSLRDKIRTLSGDWLGKHGFVTPTEVADETAWRDLLVDRLVGGEQRLALSDTGELTVLDASGNPVYDEKTVKPVTPEDLFKRQAGKLFKVAQGQPGRQGAGHGGTPQGGQGGAGSGSGSGTINVKLPATEAEYVALLGTLSREERKAYVEAWNARQAGG